MTDPKTAFANGDALVSPGGVAPNTTVHQYFGVALNVIRGDKREVLVAFDANGQVLYIDRALLHDRVDCKAPYTVQGILDALTGETP